MLINNTIFTLAITQASEKYNAISPEFAQQVINSIYQQYQNTIHCRVVSSLIIELSLVISFISLIPYQKKILDKYNV